MSRLPTDQPERLLASDATDFERRMLEAALQKKPSAKASVRMATALGVTAATVGTATAATTLAAGAAASNTTAAAGATAVWPWVSIGVLGLVVAGAVVGTRAGRHSQEPRAVSPAVTAPVLPAPTPNAATEAPAVVTESPPHAAASQRNRVATGTPDLGDQVAFIDSARAAISTGAGRRALEILRRYQDKYPAGSFRPEASALKVEALMKLGREAEARALAQRFIAENRGSLLARRVADVAGLSTP